jgi:hypothetical protein
MLFGERGRLSTWNLGIMYSQLEVRKVGLPPLLIVIVAGAG